MKKTLLYAGLTLVSAAGLQSACAAELDTVSPRPWSVSASLRGFYDDNYNISGNTKGSFGTELTPQVSVNLPMQQTDLGMRYKYGLNYFQDRDSLGLDPFDQTHQVDVWLDHAFNTRWKLNVNDSFAAGQEPELLNNSPSVPVGTPFRVNGNNIANHANFTLNTEWTRQFSTKLAYGNSVYAYDQSGMTTNQLAGGTPPSRAGGLNRVEQTVSIDFQWTIQPQTTALVGYRFNAANFTANEPISYGTNNLGKLIVHHSADGDNRTQTAYLGVQHNFTESLSGNVKGGVSDTDNYNDPYNSNSTDKLSPYVDLSLTYTYLPGSYLQMGFTHDINQTDVKTPDATTQQLTDYQESSKVYASINHRFTPKLVGSVIGNAQISDYQSGGYSNSTDYDYNLGVNLSYEINRYFSVETGYNYDDLVSNIAGRSFSRNRVYLGLTASY